MTERTALYRLFGANDLLLYVGITLDPESRYDQHSKDKPWWPEVVDKSEIWHDSWQSAKEAEDAAIKAERPVYNLNGLAPRLRVPGIAPELPAWTDDELSEIIEQVTRILARRDVSHAHARLRALNLLLHGRDELPHGAALITLATACGISNREAYKALAFERGGWPESWQADVG